jgi:hypothetical protein
MPYSDIQLFAESTIALGIGTIIFDYRLKEKCAVSPDEMALLWE